MPYFIDFKRLYKKKSRKLKPTLNYFITIAAIPAKIAPIKLLLIHF